jgi:hypothetical protein
VSAQRYGESAAKEVEAKRLIAEGRLSRREIAAAVKTSTSQVQRFVRELEDEDDRERWVRSDLPRTPDEIAALRERDVDELVLEVERLLVENERLRRKVAA